MGQAGGTARCQGTSTSGKGLNHRGWRRAMRRMRWETGGGRIDSGCGSDYNYCDLARGMMMRAVFE